MLKRFGAVGEGQRRAAPRIHAKTSRRHCIKPVAFRPSATELCDTALAFPTPFQPPPPAPALLSSKLTFHPSVWYHDLFEDASAQAGCMDGAGTYHDALSAFASCYDPSNTKALKLWSAADENSSDAFYMFVSKMKNTGAFAGCRATQTTSTVHGIMRVHMDEEGQVDNVWCFRAPTSEERRCLLKPPHPSEPVWPNILRLHAHSRQDDSSYTSNIKAASQAWVHEVLAKASTAALEQLAHPDLEYHEGHMLHSCDPMPSAEALQGDLAVRKHAWDLGDAELLAMATQENRVFVHWRLPMTCRKTKVASLTEGSSLLVYDEHGKIVQVVEYHSPNHQDRSRLFSRSFCPPPPQKPVGGGLSEEALAALARQEQEWVSW